MYKILLIFILLFWNVLEAQQKRNHRNTRYNYKYQSGSVVTDTSPPDTTGFAPSVVVNMPDTVTVSFNPSYVESADWKDIVISYSFEAGYSSTQPTIGTMTIPKATALADSDTVAIYTIPQYYWGSKASPDTLRILTTTIALRDSSDNSISYNKTSNLVLYPPPQLVVDSLYTTTITQIYFNAVEQDMRFRLSPSAMVNLNTWMVGDSIGWNGSFNFQGVGDNYNTSWADLAPNWLSSMTTDSTWRKNISITNVGYISSYAYITGEGFIKYKGINIYGDVWSAQIYADSVWQLTDLFPPRVTSFTTDGDTNKFSITAVGVFTAKDSLLINDDADTSTTIVKDWFLAPIDGDTTMDITYTIAANVDTVIYLFVKDSLNNMDVNRILHSSYTEIKNSLTAIDTLESTPGSFVATVDTPYNAILDGTSISGGDSIAGYKVYTKKNAVDNYELQYDIPFVDFPDTTLSLSGLFTIYDSLFLKVTAYDSSNVLAQSNIYDTVVVTMDNFYVTVNEDSVGNVKFIMRTDSSGANIFTEYIAIGIDASSVIDTVGNNDSTLIKIPQFYGNYGYFMAIIEQIRQTGAYRSDTSAYGWWSPPTSIGSFAANQSVSSATDSIRLIQSSFPSPFDSIRYSYNTVYWFSITDSIADTTVYQASAEAGTPDTVTAVIYYNGTYSTQTGWAQVTSDTVNVPAGGGGGFAQGDIANESFDPTGYDLAWTEHLQENGVLDEDETTIASGQSGFDTQWLEVVSDASSEANMDVDLGGGYSTLYSRFFWYLDSESAEDGYSERILSIAPNGGSFGSGEGGAEGITISLYQTSGQLSLNLVFNGGASCDSGSVSFNISVDTQYRIEVYLLDDGAEDYIAWRINGVTIGRESTGANLAGPFQDIWIGISYGTAATTSVIDNIGFDADNWIGE